MNKDLHKYSDAELLSFYRRTRKPDYLIGLYERYMPLVYGVTLKYLKNVPDAQDAVMQIWEELFEKVLHHDIQVFKAWLYSCFIQNGKRNLQLCLERKGIKANE